MKIAIISAVFGGIDVRQPFPEQDTLPEWEVTVHNFTENNTTIPRSDLIPRLRAKWFKMIPHHEMDADVFIWMDGSFKILSDQFLKWMMGNLHDHDVAVLKHPDRTSIVDELHFMKKLMRGGNKYLSQRYSQERMDEQVQHYLEKGFTDSVGLFSCGLFARRNNPKVNQAFDKWWIENTTWTIQDQLSFPFIVETHQLKVKSVPINLFNNSMFKLINHK